MAYFRVNKKGTWKEIWWISGSHPELTVCLYNDLQTIGRGSDPIVAGYLKCVSRSTSSSQIKYTFQALQDCTFTFRYLVGTQYDDVYSLSAGQTQVITTFPCHGDRATGFLLVQ